MAALREHVGRAHVLGITGAPGVGKSTSTSALVAAHAAGRHAGSACWPSTRPRRSPGVRCSATGSGWATTPSTATSTSARWAPADTSAASPGRPRRRCASSTRPGCDVVIVETVGVGQSEVEVAGLADTTLVLLAPGMGDGIQAAKAGILEIGDVYAVNKADREGADRTRRELRTMLSMARATRGRLAAAGPEDRGEHGGGDRGAPRRARPARRLAGRSRASWPDDVRRARAARSRRSPWRPCASGGGATAAARTSTSSPNAWRPATSIPTPLPTS